MATAVKKATKNAKQAKPARNAKAVKQQPAPAVPQQKPRGERWKPKAEGPTPKDHAFEAWLASPTDPTIKTELAAEHPDISDSTWNKWLSGFRTGRESKNGDSNYPRSARGKLKAILAALKKTGGQLHENERKRILSM